VEEKGGETVPAHRPLFEAVKPLFGDAEIGKLEGFEVDLKSRFSVNQ